MGNRVTTSVSSRELTDIGEVLEFFETKVGQEFFRKQIPALIKSLERLGKVFDFSGAMPRVKADSEFFSKLYYGNGGLPDGKMTPESHKLSKAVSTAYDELAAALSEGYKLKLDAYDQAMTARASYQEEQAFESGVRFAMQTVLAGVARPIDFAGSGKAAGTK